MKPNDSSERPSGVTSPAMQLVPIDREGQIGVHGEDPTGQIPGVCEQAAALYARRGFVTPWLVYVAAENGIWLGTCGFAGPPANEEVEIAYFTFPGHEGRGIATRMAAALIALTQPVASSEKLVYIAHTLPQESASTSILRRIGFQLRGSIVHPEDGLIWQWYLPDSSGPAAH